MYVLPGFVDMHAHIGGAAQGTTRRVRLQALDGPRRHHHPRSRLGQRRRVDDARARAQREERDRRAAHRGRTSFTRRATGTAARSTRPRRRGSSCSSRRRREARGSRSSAPATSIYDPEILGALLDEAKKRGLGRRPRIWRRWAWPACNVLQAARLGTAAAWSTGTDCPRRSSPIAPSRTIPPDYNYNDEQHRFGKAGRLWQQAAPPGSAKWNEVMDELLELGFTIDPTLTIYEASRDLMRAMRAEWHDKYTLPSLWQFYQPSRAGPRLVLVQLDDVRRDRVEEQLPALDGVPQRVQESRRASHHRLG